MLGMDASEEKTKCVPEGACLARLPPESGPGLRYGLRVYGALVPYGSLVIKYLSRAG